MNEITKRELGANQPILRSDAFMNCLVGQCLLSWPCALAACNPKDDGWHWANLGQLGQWAMLCSPVM
eukprot:2552683-Alexandrium_andersonii.AAC.1